MGDMLAKIIKEKTADPKVFSQRDLAQRAGISNTTINRIINGRRADPDTLEKIAPYIGYSYIDLMIMEEYLKPSFAKQISPVGEFIDLPILGTIRGGVPMLAEENIIGYAGVKADAVSNGDYYFLRVSGDSMAPRIEPGDLVLVRMAQSCNNGQIAVVMVNEDEATLKRVFWQGDMVVLHSDNTSYPPFSIDVKDIRILGCVRQTIKEER